VQGDIELVEPLLDMRWRGLPSRLSGCGQTGDASSVQPFHVFKR
jgi:hypothetical protein